ncbi:hypothetical protein SPRG_06007 [Saprolegnia parasitica CBS 223.65]|uniref:protein-tyrosine-phosphatase n=1 Tax=Saprolegnia parasitica (strain CBS 223.65) TaxID=695850 RepID=A0A067CFC5_SAPPC|nr:hypothetical protein SPRG_06007 [Saprolegnia parasitica CBS 223.65]KDO29469.1 hypothetical protein SPRG_06007 [Saprolegnia parasitica CBS 223.65]|eukprot:XP_012199968.1 hypothetical protein SPRG_06007 [Saprolegnia parasitica CBS 223.65]
MDASSMTQEVDEYVCRMCRFKLFTSEDLLEHEPHQHRIALRKMIKERNPNGVVDCSSFFMADTMPWMDEALLAEGKLHCPIKKCNARLGSFEWSGSQCSCGTWVTPSIQITKSRVDLKRPIGVQIYHVPLTEAEAATSAAPATAPTTEA